MTRRDLIIVEHFLTKKSGCVELFIHLFAVAVAALRTHPAQSHHSSDTSTDTQSCHSLLAAGTLLLRPLAPLPVRSHSSSPRQFKRLPVINGRQSGSLWRQRGKHYRAIILNRRTFPELFRTEVDRPPVLHHFIVFVWFALSFPFDCVRFAPIAVRI